MSNDYNRVAPEPSLSEEQRKDAVEIFNVYNKKFDGKIETRISKVKNYCKAESYHQNYIEKNR